MSKPLFMLFRNFEKVARYCNEFNNLIPVAFVLGFYVTLVVGRWWDQFNLIPWPDRFAMFVTAHVHGHDERGRVMRRTMMRYLCLSYVITMSSICPPVKKRFNHFSKMTEAGEHLPIIPFCALGPCLRHFLSCITALARFHGARRAENHGRNEDNL